MCGMKILAVLSVVGCIGLLFATILALVIVPANLSDGAVTTFYVLWVVIQLPLFVNGYVQIKWLLKDNY